MKNKLFVRCAIFVVIVMGAILVGTRDDNTVLEECPYHLSYMGFSLPDVVLHRGMVFGGEENSLSTIRMAFDRFPWAEVEVDVRETEDGELVLSHDPVRSSQNFTRLEDVLDLLEKHPTASLQIDSKVSCGEGCVKLAEVILSRPDLAERIIVSSGGLVLQKLHRIYPGLMLGFDPGEKELNEQSVKDIIQRAEALDANTIYLEYGLFTRIGEDIASQFVRKFQEAGLTVDVWTVDSPGDMMQAISWGVDKVTTNRPEVFAQVTHFCVPPKAVVVVGFSS